MMLMSRRQWTISAAALVAAPWANATPTFPTRPIRLIYNYAAGGPGDAVARYLAVRMATTLGQPLMVENLTGGNGVVGTLAAARAPADGYTLLFAPLPGVLLLPLLARDSNFNPLKSLTPIANVGSAPLLIIVRSDLEVNDFPGFMAWARKQPAGVDVGGGGSIVEIATAVLAREAKLKLVWVPFRGSPPAMQALLAGDVKVAFLAPSAMVSGHINSGKVKIVGVTSQDESVLAPGVAPIARHVPGFVQQVNYGMWAPGGLPSEIAGRIQAALVDALKEPDMAEKLQINGMVKDYLDAAAVAQIARREDESIRKVLATTSIKVGE
ncbi:Bug family tripartite tricarboxylate transporter substrate binding protein [Variovorax sp. LARHSF232]